MSDTPMVERLAKVLFNGSEGEWGALPLMQQLVFRSQARAVLQELREPTSGMVEAGQEVPCDDPSGGVIYSTREEVLAIHQAAIDAALSGQ